MANGTTRGLSLAEFADVQRGGAAQILEGMIGIIAWDQLMNQQVLRMTTSLADYLEKHPDAFAAKVGIRSAIRENVGGTAPNDPASFAGGDAFDEIVHTIIEILTGEKDFVKEIIMKILDL